MKADFVLYGPDGRELSKRKPTDLPWILLAFFALLVGVASPLAAHFYKSKPTPQAISGQAIPEIIFTSSTAGYITIDNPTLDVPDLGSPSDSPPSRVVTDRAIFHICYTTVRRLKEVNALAQTNLETHKIWLPQDSPATERRKYLYHELMHIAFANARGYESAAYAQYGKDEQFINPTAPELLDILRRNPKMANWLEKVRE